MVRQHRLLLHLWGPADRAPVSVVAPRLSACSGGNCTKQITLSGADRWYNYHCHRETVPLLLPWPTFVALCGSEVPPRLKIPFSRVVRPLGPHTECRAFAFRPRPTTSDIILLLFRM